MDQQRVNAARVWMTRIRVSAAAPRDPAHGWVGGTISRVPQESMRGRALEYIRMKRGPFPDESTASGRLLADPK